jgi:hypothetical protein
MMQEELDQEISTADNSDKGRADSFKEVAQLLTRSVLRLVTEELEVIIRLTLLQTPIYCN